MWSSQGFNAHKQLHLLHWRVDPISLVSCIPNHHRISTYYYIIYYTCFSHVLFHRKKTLRVMESKHIVFFFLFTLAAFITASNSKSIIKRLPGFDGDLPFSLETGYVSIFIVFTVLEFSQLIETNLFWFLERYIGVGEDEAVQIFYYFVESERNPSEDPLLIYLTGGPGTSVLYSMMYQIGN